MNERVFPNRPLAYSGINEAVKSSSLQARQGAIPAIKGLATGTPAPVVCQKASGRFVASLPQMQSHSGGIERLYQNTRIDTRRLALDVMGQDAVALCNREGTIKERMSMYMQHAVPLATDVARCALADAQGGSSIDLAVDDIGLVIYVSSTGIVAPGVDGALIKSLGLRRSTARMTVSFMGCAAALNALRLAADHVQAHPQHRVLVVCLELSSVNVAFEDDMNNVIIHSLFGDGCAAVVVGSSDGDGDNGHVLMHDHLSYLIEGTEDGIVLGLSENGVTCELARELPAYIETGLEPIIHEFLGKNTLEMADIDLWAVHPGGTRIIKNAQKALRLSDEQVASSWSVLRNFGNMLSPAVLFVLKQMLDKRNDRSLPEDEPATGLAFSFAPGLGVEGLLFEVR